MHIEFIDLLRCPRPHEETWLVAAIDQMDGRLVVEGKLGCPMCGADYSIRNGVALFIEDVGPKAALVEQAGRSTAESSEIIAAFLDLSSPGKIALLAGEFAADSEAVARLTDSRIIALNSPRANGASDVVAAIHAASPLPLGARSLDGLALDDRHSTPEMLGQAARLLRPRGRLLAKAGVELPPSFHELARDQNHVVAEYLGELVALRR
ncbi:MAG TPA: hypothetical protein VJB15_02885 [Rhodothermia bacterium]|nr:hypothetical protein [Rhodothermia bacterium]